AQSGLAPKPAGVDAEARLLVTEFVEDAIAASVDQLHDVAMIERLAAALRLLHAVPAAIPPFTPRVYAERYLARSGGIDHLSHADRDRFAELLSLADGFGTAATALCHNDLAAENLLFGQTIRFIDFDYAVCAPPIIDLASVVVMNDLAPAAARALVAAYFPGGIPFSETEFAKVQRLMRLLAHFWSLAAQYRINDV
ncbi:MAG: phosphotransferase, partial [Gammaproteobacteria bacterium]|nr:phosphotransferase [Gammaproteobacteria bacterium]